jgi:hypothetical protein
MKLTNETKYDTRILRSIMCAVHADGAAVRIGTRNARRKDGRLRTWRALEVKVVYARSRRYSGYAYYHGMYSLLRVPRGHLSPEHFAALWRHELAHLYGISHQEMGREIYRCHLGEWSRPYAERFGPTIEEKGLHEAPKAPEVEATERREAKLQELRAKLARVEAREKAWATKAKRAATGLRTAAKDRRALERKLAKVEEQPVEAFQRAARRPRAPKPKPVVPEGYVRLERRLSGLLAYDVDCVIQDAGEWLQGTDRETHERVLFAWRNLRGTRINTSHRGCTLKLLLTIADAAWFVEVLQSAGEHEVIELGFALSKQL